MYTKYTAFIIQYVSPLLFDFRNLHSINGIAGMSTWTLVNGPPILLGGPGAIVQIGTHLFKLRHYLAIHVTRYVSNV